MSLFAADSANTSLEVWDCMLQELGAIAALGVILPKTRLSLLQYGRSHDGPFQILVLFKDCFAKFALLDGPQVLGRSVHCRPCVLWGGVTISENLASRLRWMGCKCAFQGPPSRFDAEGRS